jgi:hypothetical protein
MRESARPEGCGSLDAVIGGVRAGIADARKMPVVFGQDSLFARLRMLHQGIGTICAAMAALGWSVCSLMTGTIRKFG